MDKAYLGTLLICDNNFNCNATQGKVHVELILFHSLSKYTKIWFGCILCGIGFFHVRNMLQTIHFSKLDFDVMKKHINHYWTNNYRQIDK